MQTFWCKNENIDAEKISVKKSKLFGVTKCKKVV